MLQDSLKVCELSFPCCCLLFLSFFLCFPLSLLFLCHRPCCDSVANGKDVVNLTDQEWFLRCIGKILFKLCDRNSAPGSTVKERKWCGLIDPRRPKLMREMQLDPIMCTVKRWVTEEYESKCLVCHKATKLKDVL